MELVEALARRACLHHAYGHLAATAAARARAGASTATIAIAAPSPAAPSSANGGNGPREGIAVSEEQAPAFVTALLELARYTPPSTLPLPPDAENGRFAVAASYWRSTFGRVVVAKRAQRALAGADVSVLARALRAHTGTVWLSLVAFGCLAPSTVGGVLWRRYRTARTLLEMVVTRIYHFPPLLPADGGVPADVVDDQVARREVEAVIGKAQRLGCPERGKRGHPRPVQARRMCTGRTVTCARRPPPSRRWRVWGRPRSVREPRRDRVRGPAGRSRRGVLTLFGALEPLDALRPRGTGASTAR